MKFPLSALAAFVLILPMAGPLGCNDSGFLGNSSTKDRFKGNNSSKGPEEPKFTNDATGDGDPEFEADTSPPKDISSNKGGNGSDPSPGSIDTGEKGVRRLTFDCESSIDRLIYVGSDVPEGHVQASDDTKVVAITRGEFCPTLSAQLNIVFVVDHSGSMTFKSSPLIPDGGSDPVQNGTCGRYTAIENIVSKIQSNVEPEDQVNISFVSFGTQLIANNPLVPIDTFVNQQMSPGQICNQDRNQMTNAAAGLNRATQLLSDNQVAGKKVVFFITDGVPRASQQIGPNGDQAAQQAANGAADKLKQIENINFYSVFLGSNTSQASGYPFLQALSAAPAGADNAEKRFRIEQASNAAALADVLEKFGDLIIDQDSGKARVLVEPYPEADLGLKVFDKIGKQQDGSVLYRFQTKPLVLLGLENKWVDNIITISASKRDGDEVKAKMTFRYCKIGPCPEP